MEWIAYCTVCGELDRAPNGPMMESTARLHRRDTGHTTIIGYEPSIIMSGKMVEVPLEEKEEHYWEVTNMVTGEILQSGKEHKSIRDAVRDAKTTLRSGYRDYGDNHLVIKVFDESPDERAGLTRESEHSESFWIEGAPERARETLERISRPLTERPIPQTYGDWVDLGVSIKEKAGINDFETTARVNENLEFIATDDAVHSEAAKRWLMTKAGELGIG